jgi:hypothetical protein
MSESDSTSLLFVFRESGFKRFFQISLECRPKAFSLRLTAFLEKPTKSLPESGTKGGEKPTKNFVPLSRRRFEKGGFN